MPRDENSLSVTIVKLGGSLAHTPRCAAWIEALAAWGGPLILVPGGGPFADCVRTAQAAMGFDDTTAHRMALMAMEQHGVALAAHARVFALAASRDELDSAIRAGKIPVWLPLRMILAAPEVPETWELTSDSLAAWLAGILDHDDFGLNQSKIMNVIDSKSLERDAGGKPISTFPHPALGARRLLLIKSRDQVFPVTAEELAAAKIVDPLFPRYAAQSHAEVWLAGPASLAGALHILQSGGMPGTKIAIP